ncbi:MAG: D-alanyl-D-alanine carboxypeptidase family protein [Bacteroidetes bacterium CHB5]|nr:D-alanyl-D-alanine carboxypeptidase family protein [Bacteroidetes bacterium CHB5]
MDGKEKIFEMRLIALFIVAGSLALQAQPVNKNYLLGKFDPATHPLFVKLADEHTRGSGRNAYLRKETYEAFVKMSEAALKDSVKLVIISATRNFDSQKRIWENKWNGKVRVEGKDLTTVTDPKERARLILLYSSMPATSRHHWGTDMDLNALENSYFDSGEGLRIYTWLKAHAAAYGFCQPYTTKDSGRTGYEEERWHWSYLPLSGEFLKQYKKEVSYKDITGFMGSEVAKPIAVIKNYVDGVACK